MDMSAHDIGVHRGGPGERRLPFSLPLSVQSLGFVVGAVDFLVILAAALGSALIYHGLVLRAGIQIDRYVAIAVISFVDFAVIMGGRGAYGAERLLQARRDWREVAMVWALRMSTAFLNSSSVVIPLAKSNLLFCQLSKPWILTLFKPLALRVVRNFFTKSKFTPFSFRQPMASNSKP